MHPGRGQLLIDSRDSEHVIATFNPILIAAFTRIPRDAELNTILARVADAVEAGIEGGMLYVVAREDMKGGVDARVRRVFEDMIRRNQGHAGRTAVVILTTGFAAAAIRAALAGLLTLIERRNALRVFGNVESACDWLAPHHGLPSEVLVRAFQTATAAVTAGGLNRATCDRS